MSLWFDRKEQKQKLLGYLPKGKAYKQAFIDGSNFNKLIGWIAVSFQWLVDECNKVFRGMYVCESDYLIGRWKSDYSIPNKIFYLGDKNRQDIFVLRYLMKGNTAWHFQAIANIYGVDVIITNAIEYFEESRLPNRIPHKLYESVENAREVMVINFLQDGFSSMPFDIPHKLGSGREVEKIKRIYGKIKEVQCKILYMPPKYSVETKALSDVLPSQVPHILGVRQVSVKVYEDIDLPERINFCLGENK